MNYEPLYISREAFDALGGWALKVYMLACNTERSLTSATITQELHTSERTVQRAVVELKRKGFWPATNLSPKTTNLSAKTTNLSPILKTEKERSKEKEKNINNLCLVDFRIDDASEDATNAKKKMTIEERKQVFWSRLVPYVQTGRYTKEMVTDFYLYWTEANERGKRMRFEMEKIFELPRRLATWRKREEARNYPSSSSGTGKAESRNYGGARLSAEQLAEQAIAKRRREEASEELQRQMDAAQAAAVSYSELLGGRRVAGDR